MAAILGLILARKGSERLPNKNRLPIGMTNMVDFAIGAMKTAPEITFAAISTDDEVLGAYCVDKGIKWIRRPPHLCAGNSDIKDAIYHAQTVSPVFYDYIVSFQCAVPLRPRGSVSALLQEVMKTEALGGVSVIERTPWMWRINPDGTCTKWWKGDTYPRSQDIGKTYEEINSIMVTSKEAFGGRWEYPMSFVVLPSWADFDIDDQNDYNECCDAWERIKLEYNMPRTYETFTIRGET